MTLKEANAEGGTSGATVTTADATSGDKFNLISIGSGCTFAYDNTQAAHGSQSYHMTAVAGVQCVFDYTFSATSAAGRIYVLFNSFNTNGNDLFEFRNAAGVAAKVQILNNKFGIADASSSLPTFTTALTTGTWYRVEMWASAGTSTSNGTLNVAYYLGDASTPVETPYSSTTRNIGTTSLTTLRTGKITTASAVLDANFDNVAANDGRTSFIGPVTSATASSAVAFNERQAVNQVAAEAFNVLTGVTRSGQVVFNDLAATSKMAGQAWNVRVVTGQSASVPWNVRILATRSVTQPWNDLGLVARQAADTWDTLARVAVSANETYNVRVLAGASAGESWNARMVAGSSSTVLWDSSGSLTVGASSPWRVLVSVSASRSAPWNVTLTVGSSSAEIWRDLVTVAVSRADAWNARSLTLSQRAVVFNDLSRLATTAAFAFRDLVIVTQADAIRHNVLASLTAGDLTAWRDLATVVADSDSILWHIFREIDLNGPVELVVIDGGNAVVLLRQNATEAVLALPRLEASLMKETRR